MIRSVVDNDVFFKGACYGLLAEIFHSLPQEFHDVGYVAAIRFVLTKKLKKRPPRRGSDAAIADLEGSLALLHSLEPTEDEVKVAASLEFEAQRMGVALDSGESVLCAIAISRGIDYLITGDKRAIVAINALIAANVAPAASLRHRCVCLEMLFGWTLVKFAANSIRARISAEKGTDRTLDICFSCFAPEIAEPDVAGALASYISDLRTQAPQSLIH